MKKLTLHGVALATMTVFALVSCQKEKATMSEFTATVEHCTDDNGKVMLDGNVLRWTDGDQIAVWGSDGMGTYTTSNVGEHVTTFNFTEGDDPGDPTYTAIYPASLAQRSSVILLPPVQTSTDGSLQQFPMMARSSNSELVFKNLCGALRLRLQSTGKSVVGIELSTFNNYQSLWGVYRLNYNGGEPTITHTTGIGHYQVMLSIINPQDITSPKDFYIALPPATYSAGCSIRIYTSDGSVCTKTITSGHSFRIERSGIFTITLRDDDLLFEPSAGSLSGEFSVSPTQKVRFSQGWLMYTGFGTHAVAGGGHSVGTWRFHQYQFYSDYEHNFASGDAYTTGWINQFSWGTSGWNSGAVCYMPYQNSGSTFGAVGTNNLTGTYVYSDWGVYNAILNGGNQPQQWRTLSSDEWDYLLNHRRGSAVKWGIAQIETVTGLVLLPDSWSQPSGIEFNEGLAMGSTVLNNYSRSQWKLMEDAGAVFMLGGSYWTTTRSSSAHSCRLVISNSNVGIDQVYSHYYPCFVRLVKDVN